MARRNRIGSAIDIILLGSILAFISVLSLILTLDLAGFVNIISFNFPLNVSEFASIVGAIASIILYFGLVILYREQAHIQDKQEEWMEAEHTPGITVERWEVSGNELEFSISNVGTGIAKNLSVEIEVDILTSKGDITSASIIGTDELWRKDVFSRVIEQQQTDPPREFEGNPVFLMEWYPDGTFISKYFSSSESIEGSFSDVLSILYDEGVEIISYKVDISFSYSTDRLGDIVTVWEGEAELEEDMDFEGVILETYEPYDSGLNVKPDNWEALDEG